MKYEIILGLSNKTDINYESPIVHEVWRILGWLIVNTNNND